jgi:D-inositol-3-phosphate glycosyltransferase
MKILAVSHYYPPHIGGLEIVAEKLAVSLSAAGHTVSVVTFAGGGEQRGVETKNGVTVYRVGGLNFFESTFGIPFPIGGIGLIFRIWKEVKNADAIHLHDVFYQSSWVTLVFVALYRRPLFLTQHVGYVSHPNQMVMLVQKLVYATFGKALFTYATKIISYNKIVTAFLKEQGVSSSKVLELRNGIQISAYQKVSAEEKEKLRIAHGLPVDRPLALFVGRFVPKKGYDKLFAARDAAYDLVFVGSGTFPEEWKKESGVHYLGPQTPEALRSIYALADMFVFPATGELFTLVMQEAMASSLPIITTNEPAYYEYGLDDSRISLVPAEPDALKQAMQKVAGDLSLQKEMGEYSRKIAEEWFDWDTNSTPVLDLYSAIEKKKQTGLQSVLVTTSWDDGHVLDIRLAELLKKYGIKGTLYISPRDHEFAPSLLLTPEQVKELHRDFEIGAHTLTHRPLPTLSRVSANYEIIGSKQYLEELIGAPVVSFCYPRGEYQEEHVSDVEDAGFTLARTVKRFTYDVGDSPYTLPTTIHAYDHFSDIWGVLRLAHWNPFQFWKLYRNWEAQALAMFDEVQKKGGIFHLWGHSWEVDNHGDWERLESVLKYIGNREGVRYVTNAELLQ